MVNCSNYRMGACMNGSCPNDKPECCQECDIKACCTDRDCGGPDQQTRYTRGYMSVSPLDWSTIPVDEAIKRIDAYKSMAFTRGNEFYAGVAEGAWNYLMQRELVA